MTQKESIKANARELYRLADICRVPMLRACKRISMATSTPHRWAQHASEPGAGQMDALRASILRIAHEQGSLPPQFVAEYEALPKVKRRNQAKAVRPPLEIARDLARNVAELEQSLTAEE